MLMILLMKEIFFDFRSSEFLADAPVMTEHDPVTVHVNNNIIIDCWSGESHTCITKKILKNNKSMAVFVFVTFA